MSFSFITSLALLMSQGFLSKKLLPSSYEIAHLVEKKSLGNKEEKLTNFLLTKTKNQKDSPFLINDIISEDLGYKETFEIFKENTSEIRNKQIKKTKSRSRRSSFEKKYQSFDKWLDSEISKFYPKFRLVKAIAGEIYYYEDKLQKNLQDNFKILKDILRYRNLSYKAFKNEDEKLEEEWDKSIEKNFDLIYKTHYFQSFAKKIIENKSSFLYFINEIIAKHELLINKQIKNLQQQINDSKDGKDDSKILGEISDLWTRKETLKGNLNRFKESKQDEKILNYLGIKSFKINSFSWEEQVINSKINIEYRPESKFVSLGDIEKQFDIVEIIDLIKSIDDWDIKHDITKGKFVLINRYKKDNKIELAINHILEGKIDYYKESDLDKYENLGVISLKRYLNFRNNVIKQYNEIYSDNISLNETKMNTLFENIKNDIKNKLSVHEDKVKSFDKAIAFFRKFDVSIWTFNNQVVDSKKWIEEAKNIIATAPKIGSNVKKLQTTRLINLENKIKLRLEMASRELARLTTTAKQDAKEIINFTSNIIEKHEEEIIKLKQRLQLLQNSSPTIKKEINDSLKEATKLLDEAKENIKPYLDLSQANLEKLLEASTKEAYSYEKVEDAQIKIDLAKNKLEILSKTKSNKAELYKTNEDFDKKNMEVLKLDEKISSLNISSTFDKFEDFSQKLQHFESEINNLEIKLNKIDSKLNKIAIDDPDKDLIFEKKKDLGNKIKKLYEIVDTNYFILAKRSFEKLDQNIKNVNIDSWNISKLLEVQTNLDLAKNYINDANKDKNYVEEIKKLNDRLQLLWKYFIEKMVNNNEKDINSAWENNEKIQNQILNLANIDFAKFKEINDEIKAIKAIKDKSDLYYWTNFEKLVDKITSNNVKVAINNKIKTIKTKTNDLLKGISKQLQQDIASVTLPITKFNENDKKYNDIKNASIKLKHLVDLKELQSSQNDLDKQIDNLNTKLVKNSSKSIKQVLTKLKSNTKTLTTKIIGLETKITNDWLKKIKYEEILEQKTSLKVGMDQAKNRKFWPLKERNIMKASFVEDIKNLKKLWTTHSATHMQTLAFLNKYPQFTFKNLEKIRELKIDAFYIKYQRFADKYLSW